MEISDGVQGFLALTGLDIGVETPTLTASDMTEKAKTGRKMSSDCAEEWEV